MALWAGWLEEGGQTLAWARAVLGVHDRATFSGNGGALNRLLECLSYQSGGEPPMGVMGVKKTIVCAVVALGCIAAAGGRVLYRHAVALPAEQAQRHALDAQQRAEVHAREVDRTVSYARCLEAVGLGARARKADQCHKLGQGMGCELPEDAESALGRQRERGEVQCFNEAKIGL